MALFDLCVYLLTLPFQLNALTNARPHQHLPSSSFAPHHHLSIIIHVPSSLPSPPHHIAHVTHSGQLKNVALVHSSISPSNPILNSHVGFPPMLHCLGYSWLQALQESKGVKPDEAVLLLVVPFRVVSLLEMSLIFFFSM
jgi:hypothetical protein